MHSVTVGYYIVHSTLQKKVHLLGLRTQIFPQGSFFEMRIMIQVCRQAKILIILSNSLQPIIPFPHLETKSSQNPLKYTQLGFP